MPGVAAVFMPAEREVRPAPGACDWRHFPLLALRVMVRRLGYNEALGIFTNDALRWYIARIEWWTVPDDSTREELIYCLFDSIFRESPWAQEMEAELMPPEEEEREEEEEEEEEMRQPDSEPDPEAEQDSEVQAMNLLDWTVDLINEELALIDADLSMLRGVGPTLMPRRAQAPRLPDAHVVRMFRYVLELREITRARSRSASRSRSRRRSRSDSGRRRRSRSDSRRRSRSDSRSARAASAEGAAAAAVEDIEDAATVEGAAAVVQVDSSDAEA